jgi:hypothetical protein
LHAEQREECGAGQTGADALGWPVAADEVAVALGVDGDGRERAAHLAHVFVFGIREHHLEMVLRGEMTGEDHELVRVAIGQRPQQHAVDDAEDGAVGADAERQRQHRRQRHAGGAAQHARGEAHVFEQRLHHAAERFSSTTRPSNRLMVRVACLA